MKVKYDRARVNRDAKRLTLVGVPLSVAMRESWRAEKLRVLKRMLASGVVEFTFKEAGKQLQRTIAGTTVPHLIPKDKLQNMPARESVRNPFLYVYDTKSDNWTPLNRSKVEIEFT